MTGPGQPDWLTTAELAKRWRLTPRTLERWRAECFGPVWHEFRGRVLYPLDDVLAYEARHRREAGNPSAKSANASRG